MTTLSDFAENNKPKEPAKKVESKEFDPFGFIYSQLTAIEGTVLSVKKVNKNSYRANWYDPHDMSIVKSKYLMLTIEDGKPTIVYPSQQ